MRLFIAIHFSDEVKSVLLDTISKLQSQAISGNFTNPENLHLTLAFIGESNNVTAIRKAIDSCAVPPFDMAVDGFGHFGDLYWVGIEKNPTLSALADNLQNALRKSGFNIEKRAFKPHITIARRVQTDTPIRLDVLKTSMTVSRISLMKSERILGRLTYTEVYGRAL